MNLKKENETSNKPITENIVKHNLNAISGKTSNKLVTTENETSNRTSNKLVTSDLEKSGKVLTKTYSKLTGLKRVIIDHIFELCFMNEEAPQSLWL